MFSQNNNNNIVKKGRTYNFCLNSNFGTGAPTASTKFFVDWSLLPEGEYKVTFTFTSAVTATDLGSTVNAILYLDVGQGSTSMIEATGTDNTYANIGQRGSFLGCLRQTSYPISTEYITFLYADINSNPPVYLFSRPRNNSVSVDIHTSSTTTTTNYSPIGSYVLTLSFELQ